MIRYMRVGIPIVGGKAWLGGVSVLHLLMKALNLLPKQERPQTYLIVGDTGLPEYDCHQPFANLFDGIIFLGEKREEAEHVIGENIIFCKTKDLLFNLIDFLYPVSMGYLPGRCAAAWIHDFQHRYFSNLFLPREVKNRDSRFKDIAENAKLIYVASESIKKDFEKFFPTSSAVVVPILQRVCPEEEWYKKDPIMIQNKYKLPEKFILCSNQFWMHKNHGRLLMAIAQLHEKNFDVHLVCTGNPEDFRNSDYFPRLQKYISDAKIDHLVHILGLIPREDQIQLLRRSMFVVQPSLFEGQGLIVQECTTFGKTILLSDLAVHQEQNFKYAVFFRRENVEELAQKIQMIVQQENPGPNLERESLAKQNAYNLSIDYARKFCSLVYQSQIIFQKK